MYFHKDTQFYQGIGVKISFLFILKQMEMGQNSFNIEETAYRFYEEVIQHIDYSINSLSAVCVLTSIL